MRSSAIGMGSVMNKFSLLCIPSTDSDYRRGEACAADQRLKLIRLQKPQGPMVDHGEEPKTSAVLKMRFLFLVRDNGTHSIIKGYTEENEWAVYFTSSQGPYGQMYSCPQLFATALCAGTVLSTPWTSGFMWLGLTREMWAVCHFPTEALGATGNSLLLVIPSKNPLQWFPYGGQKYRDGHWTRLTSSWQCCKISTVCLAFHFRR